MPHTEKNLTKPSYQSQQYLSLTEVATRLGYKDRQTIRKWCDSGLLKFHRFPGRGDGEYRINKSDLIAFEAKHLRA